MLALLVGCQIVKKKKEKKNACGNASCKLMRWLQVDFSGLLPTLKEHKPLRREELYNVYHLL